MQSKLGSFIEACANIVIGYTVAITAQMMIFPVFNIHIEHHEHHLLGLFFTAVSLIRSYFLRRLFNYLHKEGIDGDYILRLIKRS